MVNDRELEDEIRRLLGARAIDATICPSEVARSLGDDDWRDLMEPVRQSARRVTDATFMAEVPGPVFVGSGADELQAVVKYDLLDDGTVVNDAVPHVPPMNQARISTRSGYGHVAEVTTEAGPANTGPASRSSDRRIRRRGAKEA